SGRNAAVRLFVPLRWGPGRADRPATRRSKGHNLSRICPKVNGFGILRDRNEFLRGAMPRPTQPGRSIVEEEVAPPCLEPPNGPRSDAGRVVQPHAPLRWPRGRTGTPEGVDGRHDAVPRRSLPRSQARAARAGPSAG